MSASSMKQNWDSELFKASISIMCGSFSLIGLTEELRVIILRRKREVVHIRGISGGSHNLRENPCKPWQKKVV
jgi:hypothetical protein